MSVVDYLRTKILVYWWQLILFVVSANLAGVIPALFSDVGRGGWYGQLKKPGFTPPNAAFTPVWTYLYCTMGLAAFLVWRDGDGFTGKAGLSLRVYFFNLLLNLTWTPVFFNGRSLEGGAIIIIMLVAVVITLMFLFWKFNRLSSLLLFPYLIWLSIATSLNFTLYAMNRYDEF
ncbi:Translocator protein [Trichoplax sp. H2]|uniref:Uncharacterized protein n=1 Tax=Trichoplax adhaerens TaxID=10228 RepID=B3RRP3_TRIAD|nr:expressed hypothetical protein [Trichoplax adhaerens]EDV26904.1 expressed hypothetical protein [Trichoplax adhaerens]RDD43749.1 Translocator protein [Trichoplax sp. H2]|eukprot:XP_002110900.1 expressed hypothetical protein [Trichoplax adhaerens]